MAPDTKTRMIDAAVVQLQRKGLEGMNFTDILAESGAARGAIYHHFPGGKNELAAEAVTRNGAAVRIQLGTLAAENALAVVDGFLAAVAPVVAASARGGGCAVAAVTVGEPGPDRGNGIDLRAVAETVFSDWAAALASRFVIAGLPKDHAEDLAATMLIMLEGAHVLCRASGTLTPFDQAVRTVTDLVRFRYLAGNLK